MCRPRKLSQAKQEELIARYVLFLENRPSKISLDLGINLRTFREYLKRHMGVATLTGKPR